MPTEPGTTRRRHARACLGLVAFVGGCISYAPPIRTGHYGSPGRMDAGMVEAGLGGGYGPETAGKGNLGYGVTEDVTVEAGAEVAVDERAIAWLGARYTPRRPDGFASFTYDVEGGAGAGVGGQRCVDSKCESSDLDFRRPAGGGYLGLGIGGKFNWFWPWLRLRTQVSGARAVPVTGFTTLMAGVQFSILDLAHIYFGTGGVWVVNAEIDTVGWNAIDGGLSFTIPTPRTRRERAQR